MKFVLISLCLALLSLGCYRESDYEIDSDKSKNLFKVTVEKPSVLADGFSTSQIVIAFDNSVDSLKAQTVFKTTSGLFVESGTATFTAMPKFNYDSSKLIVTAKLKSTQKVDSTVISVEVAGFIKSVVIKFTQSYPEITDLTANTFTVKPKNNQEGEVQFSNKISKLQGSPSLNSQVDLNIYDSVFRPIGNFRVNSNRSDTNGNTNYVYVLGDSIANNGIKYIGKLYAISKVQSLESPVQYLRDTVIIISSN